MSEIAQLKDPKNRRRVVFSTIALLIALVVGVGLSQVFGGVCNWQIERNSHAEFTGVFLLNPCSGEVIYVNPYRGRRKIDWEF